MKIYGVNDPFDRNTKGDHNGNIYSIDDAEIKIESFYAGATRIYDSYYLRIYSTEIQRGRHEVLKFFRVSDHEHKEKHQKNKKVLTLTKEESRVVEDGKKLELVALNVEDIRRAIYDAVDKLNEFLRKEYMKLNSEADEMIDEIAELSKN